jgi:hypothetical protein
LLIYDVPVVPVVVPVVPVVRVVAATVPGVVVLHIAISNHKT